MNFDVRWDTPEGKDPDISSPKLRMYHRALWSKPVPSGEILSLSLNKTDAYLHHISSLGEFRLSSDIMINTYSTARRTAHLFSAEMQAVAKQFDNIAHTIGNFIVFPSNRLEGKMTINGARGCSPKIQDRFDLTLECIRRHYADLGSPLTDTLARYYDFFGLFETFNNYVEFFHLDDLVDSDGQIKFFLPFDDFQSSPLPRDSEQYKLFSSRASEFIVSRNLRISEI